MAGEGSTGARGVGGSRHLSKAPIVKGQAGRQAGKPVGTDTHRCWRDVACVRAVVGRSRGIARACNAQVMFHTTVRRGGEDPEQFLDLVSDAPRVMEPRRRGGAGPPLSMRQLAQAQAAQAEARRRAALQQQLLQLNMAAQAAARRQAEAEEEARREAARRAMLESAR